MRGFFIAFEISDGRHPLLLNWIHLVLPTLQTSPNGHKTPPVRNNLIMYTLSM
jgi:hypothetical protein